MVWCGFLQLLYLGATKHFLTQIACMQLCTGAAYWPHRAQESSQQDASLSCLQIRGPQFQLCAAELETMEAPTSKSTYLKLGTSGKHLITISARPSQRLGLASAPRYYVGIIATLTLGAP